MLLGIRIEVAPHQPCLKSQDSAATECMEDSFLIELASEPTRWGALLDLLFMNRKGLVGDVVVGAVTRVTTKWQSSLFLEKSGAMSVKLLSWTSEGRLNCSGHR